MSPEEVVACFRRWRPLLFDVAADIHPERWLRAGVPAGAAARLAGCSRSRTALSRDLGWMLPDEARNFAGWDLSAADGITLRALAPGRDLWSWGLRVGAARHRADIAGMVSGRDVAAFKERVGADIYDFALRSAPLLWREAELRDGGGGMDVSERVVRSAGLALGCWLAGLETELAARARLKLPPECDAWSAETAAWSDDDRRAWLDAAKRIRME